MNKLAIYSVVLLAFAGQVAFAHTQLSGSMPADKAVLENAPDEVALDFSEAVRLTALSIQRQGDATRDLGPLPAEMSRHFAVPAPELRAGSFVVSWRALSEDTHVMTGEFTFTVSVQGSASR